MFAEVSAATLLPITGGLIGIFFSLPAVLATWRGHDRPSWVSWAVWTGTTGLGAATSIAAGSVVAAVVPLAALVRCGAMFFATVRGLRRYRDDRAGTSRLEWTCLALCVVTAVTWRVTGNPTIALLAACLTDGIASGPTWRLAWSRQESALLWMGAAASPALTVLVLRGRSVSTWAYPLYELTLCASMTAVILVRGRVATRRHRRSEAGKGVVALPRLGQVGVVGATAGLLAFALTLATGLVGAPGPVVPAAAAAPAALIASPAVVLVSGRAAPVEAAAIPTVTKTVSTPPSPGYMEMAPSGRYALIAHRTQMLVSVFDTQLGQITTTIPTPQAPPRFVTFCPTAEDRAAGRSGDRAYISMFDDPADEPPTGQNRHLIGVLDTTTNEMVATIPVGSRPFAGACSPDGTQLWVPSHDDGRVDVIDTATDRLIRSVPVPPNPHWLAFSADGRKVYAACHDSNLVAVLDPVAFTVLRTIPVGTSPHSTALSPDGRSLAVVNYTSSDVSIIDTARDAEVKRLPTGENPQDVTWSADGRLIYTANVDGQVNGRPVGNMSVINVATGGQSRLVTGDPGVDSAPTSIARSADGATGYVTNLRTGTVTVYALGR
jgi:YVTN family beta-propeller protein